MLSLSLILIPASVTCPYYVIPETQTAARARFVTAAYIDPFAAHPHTKLHSKVRAKKKFHACGFVNFSRSLSSSLSDPICFPHISLSLSHFFFRSFRHRFDEVSRELERKNTESCPVSLSLSLLQAPFRIFRRDDFHTRLIIISRFKRCVRAKYEYLSRGDTFLPLRIIYTYTIYTTLR